MRGRGREAEVKGEHCVSPLASPLSPSQPGQAGPCSLLARLLTRGWVDTGQPCRSAVTWRPGEEEEVEEEEGGLPGLAAIVRRAWAPGAGSECSQMCSAGNKTAHWFLSAAENPGRDPQQQASTRWLQCALQQQGGAGHWDSLAGPQKSALGVTACSARYRGVGCTLHPCPLPPGLCPCLGEGLVPARCL